MVVLAAGVGASALAGPLGLSLPQAPTPGTTVLTFPRPPLFRTVCAMHTPRDHPEMLLNIRQLADGTVMVHGGTHGGSVGDRSQEDVARLLAAAAEYLPALKGARVREIRRAMRPMPADGLPILGFCTAITNLYCAVTHSGVTLAPLIGEFGAQEILDGVRIDALEPYRIERFRDGPPKDIG
jgi:glycine/D-amino acid oxidase-like deaminating enzyme